MLGVDYRISISDWTLYLDESWPLPRAASAGTDVEFRLHMDP